jgi:hypothetical protein
MLDGLRQTERLRNDQGWTPSFPCAQRLTVGPLEDAAIAVPAVAEPTEGALMRPLKREVDRLLNEGLT